MRKNGYTLTELIAVLAIVAVIGAIAIPGFSRMKTKGEKSQAIAYLRNIRTAEKMYYGKWKTYLTLANSSVIQSVLRVESKLPTYAFAVNASAQTFSATATGPGGTMVIDESGVWTGTDPARPLAAD